MMRPLKSGELRPTLSCRLTCNLQPMTLNAFRTQESQTINGNMGAACPSPEQEFPPTANSFYPLNDAQL